MINLERLAAAFATARDDLLAECEPDGHWPGRLSSSALATATALSALILARQQARTAGAGLTPPRTPLPTPQEILGDAEFDRFVLRGLYWLVRRQNDDGGWGDTDRSASNLAATMLVRATFQLTGLPAGAPDLMSRADAYIAEQGGARALKRLYGGDKTLSAPVLTNCALAGTVPWREVAALPFELACLPRSAFRFLRLPVASHAVPALVAVGQARYRRLPPWNPLLRVVRGAAIARTLKLLSAMQPASGGFLESVPLTSFVVMSLAGAGPATQRVVERGMRFLIDSVREDGSWPLIGNLAARVTTLGVAALLCGANVGPHEADAETGDGLSPTDDLPLSQWRDWILARQHRQAHPCTGAAVGGWGAADLPGAAPDADNTAGALLALAAIASAAAAPPGSPGGHPWQHATRFGRFEHPAEALPPAAQPDFERHAPAIDDRTAQAAVKGIDWLIQMQNDDGGWSAFCRGWRTLVADRSATDVTAHAVRALAAWSRRFAAAHVEEPQRVAQAAAISAALVRGLEFLTSQQREDGCWSPLSFGDRHLPQRQNLVCGTARVLLAYRDARELGAPAAQRGFDWLLSAQNQSGGWGGGDVPGRPSTKAVATAGSPPDGRSESPTTAELRQPRDDASSVEETSLALEALLGHPGWDADPARGEKVAHALEWLTDAVEADRHQQPAPIGLCFGSLAYYEKLYPQIFAVSALAAARARLAAPHHPHPASLQAAR